MQRDTDEISGVPLIDISVGGRFHAFDLARELLAFGMLRHLHTGYPAFVTPRFGVPRRVVRSVWTGEPVNRMISWLHRRSWIAERRDYVLSRRHDRIVASRLRPGADVFIGWSSQCRTSLTVARRFGMTTVVERGSAHIQWQQHQLMEEARLTHLQVEVPDLRSIEQELAEYEAADYISVPSTFSARTFLAKGVPSAKLLVNPYGVDLSLFFRGDHQPPEPKPTGLRVLHVGRVSAQKGVHYLLQAVQRVPGATLTLVGALDRGMEAVVCDKRRVNVVGPVPGRQLPTWYRGADVFCLLSVQEGLALVIAQAMAMALPVIATPNTGAEELIRDGVHGFIVPERDPAAAAVRLQQLADDPNLRYEMGQRARARVGEGFGWAHYGARARANYRRVVSARRRSLENAGARSSFAQSDSDAGTVDSAPRNLIGR